MRGLPDSGCSHTHSLPSHSRCVIDSNAYRYPHPIGYSVPHAGGDAHPLPHPGGDGLPIAHPVARGEHVAHGDADATRHPDADAVQVRVSQRLEAPSQRLSVQTWGPTRRMRVAGWRSPRRILHSFSDMGGGEDQDVSTR